MTVRTRGFAVVKGEIILGIYSANRLGIPDIKMVREAVKSYELTVMQDRQIDQPNKLVFRRKMVESDDPTAMSRASGDMVCDVCKYAYRNHPISELFPPDHILCDGRRVHL